jgi:hypothetical protein
MYHTYLTDIYSAVIIECPVNFWISLPEEPDFPAVRSVQRDSGC